MYFFTGLQNRSSIEFGRRLELVFVVVFVWCAPWELLPETGGDMFEFAVCNGNADKDELEDHPLTSWGNDLCIRCPAQ